MTSVVAIETLVRGYSQAVDRWIEASNAQDQDAAFHAVFEALNWATSIDEHPARQAQPARTRHRQEHRKRVQDGRL